MLFMTSTRTITRTEIVKVKSEAQLDSMSYSAPLLMSNNQTTRATNDKSKLPFHVPIARCDDKTQQFELDASDAADRYRQYAADAYRFMLGPMPVREFLNEFLPRYSKKRMPSSRDAFKGVPKESSHDKDIYEPLVSRTIVSQKSDV